MPGVILFKRIGIRLLQLFQLPQQSLMVKQTSKEGYALVMGLTVAGVVAIASAGLVSLSGSSQKRLLPKVGEEQLRQDVRASLEVAIKDLTTDDKFSSTPADYWTGTTEPRSIYGKLSKLTNAGVTHAMFADICGPMLGGAFEDAFTDASFVDNDHDLCGSGMIDADKTTAPRLIGPWTSNQHRLATFVSLQATGQNCPSPQNVTYLIVACGYSGSRVEDASGSISNQAMEIAQLSRRSGVWNLVTWERR